MRIRLQFGGWLLALEISAMVAAPCFAQQANWAQNRPADKPPKEQRQQPQRRQEQTPGPRQQQSGARRVQAERRQNENARRPSGPYPNRLDMNARPNNNPNRPDSNARLNNNPNRPPSAYTPPPARKFDNLPRQEQQKVLQYNKSFEKLTPAQRQDLRDRQRIWSQMTPEQQNHVRNDVLPMWKQMPPDRQRAIRQRLGVLQNMPEFARNQHLNDPNFTRGMSEEDKAVLRDLSHMHIGAPDPPNE